MRVIDAKNMDVVQYGVPWTHKISPCSKHAIQLLERNTKIVTWLAKPGGIVQDQIPCIQYKDKYYSLSLRMQKAIYRHIRLKKGFQNLEKVDGVLKLKIPDILLREKMRTQSRFDAMRAASLNSNLLPSTTSDMSNVSKRTKCRKLKHVYELNDASDKIDPNIVNHCTVYTNKKERLKNTNTIAAKMKQVVDNLIDTTKKEETRTPITIFMYKSQQSEIISSFLNEMRKENTQLFVNRSQFFNLIMDKYDDLMLAINDEYPCDSRKVVKPA